MNLNEPNLLTHFAEVTSKTSKGNAKDSGLSCVVYAGKCAGEGDLATSLLVHRAIVEDEVNEEDCDVTGLLMGQGNSVLHLLEGPPFSILRILRKLSQHESFAAGKQTGKVIYSVEDRPERVYPEWYSCSLQERKANIEEITPESVNDIVTEVSNALFQVGTVLQTTPHEEVEMSSHAETLPAKNLILDLCASEEFFDLQEYVEYYTAPYNLSLERDQLWPMESPMF